MFNLSTEIICDIIVRAREITIEDELFVPGDPDSPAIDNAKPILAEDEKDLTPIEVKKIISELEPDQQHELVALMYLGRGDFEKTEWHAALKEAKNIPLYKTADYLISHPMLANYLQEGLAAFDIPCDE